MNVIEDSFIYKCIKYIFNVIKNIFNKSLVFNYFLVDSKMDISDYLKDSLVYGICRRSICFIREVVYKSKIDKYLRNSIFSNSLFWLCLLVVGIPILPTYILGILSIISFISLVFRYCVDNEFKLRKISVNYLIVAFIICIVIFSLLSINNVKLIAIMVVNVMYMLNYFVVINSIRNKNDLDKFLSYFLVVGLLVCIYGVYQYFSGNVLLTNGWVDITLFNNIDKRMLGTFNNPNIFGEYLIFYIVICFGEFITNKGKKKLALLIALIISSVCLLLTYSRGCFIGLIVALVLLVVILNKKIVLLFIILLLLGMWCFPDSILDRIFSIINLSDTSIAYRINIWDTTASMLNDFWFSGVGYGVNNFLHVFMYYSNFYLYAEHAHNLFLVIFSELGIVGLLVFLLIIILFYKRGISLYIKSNYNIDKDRSRIRIQLLSIMCSILGMLIMGIFDDIWYNNSIMLLFFIIMGLGIGITFILEEYYDKR